MAIQPLQFSPMNATVPKMDFSSLGELGDIYRQNQLKGDIQRAAAANGGKMDLGSLASIYLKHGNVEGAKSLAQLAQAQELQKSTILHHRAQEAIANRQIGLAETQAVEKPQYMKDDEGNIVEIKPRGAGASILKPQGAARAPDVFVPPGVNRKKYLEERGRQLAQVDDKALDVADKAVQSGKNVISILDDALKINKQAYSGPFAAQRGYITSQFGSKAGEATENLTNMTTMNALESLKTTFGAMPTEGERKVLLEVQGSVNKSPQVREDIFKRARALAQVRLEANKKEANDRRSGQYLLPESQRGNPAVSGLPKPTTPAERDALPSGAQYIAPDGSVRTRP